MAKIAGISDFRKTAFPFRLTLTTGVPESFADRTFGTAGRIHLLPLEVPYPFIVTDLSVLTGSTIAGTGKCRLGIYDSDADSESGKPDGTALLASGPEISLLATGTRYKSTLASAILIDCGLYFAAITGDTAADTIRAMSSSLSLIPQKRRVTVDPGYGALPNPCPATTQGSGEPFHIEVHGRTLTL